MNKGNKYRRRGPVPRKSSLFAPGKQPKTMKKVAKDFNIIFRKYNIFLFGRFQKSWKLKMAMKKILGGQNKLLWGYFKFASFWGE